MSSAVNKEKAKVFETILSSPGMNQSCKISFKISRQNVLLLCRLIEGGVLSPTSRFDDEILNVVAEKSTSEFKIIYEEILKKADLTDFYEKLKTF